MVSGQPGGAPTVLRVVLGRRLHDLRERAGVTYEQAAAALDVTHATVRRMEKAQVGLKTPYVEKLLRLYGTDDQREVEAFVGLARESNRPGWWHRYRDVLPGWIGALVSLEAAAEEIGVYAPQHVPGLLQTPDYAREVLRAGRPRVTDAELDRLVALRAARQEHLFGRPEPPLLRVVMDETVLRRRIGSPRQARAQLDRLVEAAAEPRVLLQVMPYAAGPHPAMYGPFHLFRFPVPELSDVACAESLAGGSYFDQCDHVTAFRAALDRMDAQALPADRTAELLDAVRAEL